jgi:CubicO group peptidase (beta-lactamase class C family)
MSYKFKANCLKFRLVLVFMLLCLIGKAQYNFTDADDLLTANQKKLGDNFVMLVYKDGKMVYQKEMGEIKIKTRVPVADCSKWLTAALVMTFVDEGKLSLDDKVVTYLPIFGSYSKSYITIRTCLSHLIGIADEQKIGSKIIKRKKFESLEEEVNSFAKKEIATNPGTEFFYGNMGLSIAGRVLEVITKKKFETLAKQRIFTPLGMRNTTFVGEEDAIDPSAGAITTAPDYMNFLTMILNKGMFAGKRILSEAAVAQMETIQTNNVPKKYTPKITEGFEYGLGQWIQEKDDSGNSTVIGCPGLFGAWPYIDKCRGYACILFTGDLVPGLKQDFYLKLKEIIDEQMPSSCK